MGVCVCVREIAIYMQSESDRERKGEELDLPDLDVGCEPGGGHDPG